MQQSATTSQSRSAWKSNKSQKNRQDVQKIPMKTNSMNDIIAARFLKRKLQQESTAAKNGTKLETRGHMRSHGAETASVNSSAKAQQHRDDKMQNHLRNGRKKQGKISVQIPPPPVFDQEKPIEVKRELFEQFNELEIEKEQVGISDDKEVSSTGNRLFSSFCSSNDGNSISTFQYPLSEGISADFRDQVENTKKNDRADEPGIYASPTVEM